MQEFFGEYYNIIGGVSLGTTALIFWRILTFFKKDKYLLPFVNIAKTKAIELVGKANYNAFMEIAKDVKINELPEAWEQLKTTITNNDKKIDFIIKVWLELKLLEDFPALLEEAHNLVDEQ